MQPTNSKIQVGISACVLGQAVRFDGGHKRNRYVASELDSYFDFVPVCPEVESGMPVPRPTIRLVDEQNQIRLRETKNGQRDHTENMIAYSQQRVSSLSSMALCGYVVCAKSPTCGMERVKVYSTNHAEKRGVGLYTEELMKQMPWLPIEEDGRLNDPLLRENFIERVFCLHDLYQSVSDAPTANEIIAFHSRYKLTLMAHHPQSYKKLGQLVASFSQYDEREFFEAYRLQLMEALRFQATRKNNTNVLMHLQGYFKSKLDKSQKRDLTQVIHDYRKGTLPLLAPLTLIKHYLKLFPQPYLQQQQFLSPYPEELGLRYGL